MRKFLFLSSLVAIAILSLRIATAAPAPKYFVCKYVGTPGVNEVLQTGLNPISVSGNAITPPIVIGGYFADAQGRSLVVAEDTGQPEPACPVNDPYATPNPYPTPAVYQTPTQYTTPPVYQTPAIYTTPETATQPKPVVLPNTSNGRK